MLRDLWDFLTDRRQLSMRDRETGEVHWKLNLSPIALWGSVITIFILLFVSLMLIMAYTPILDIFPSYRTKNEEMHDKMVNAIMHSNAMEQSMSDVIEYNDAVTCILNGRTPASQSILLSDSTRYDKSTVARNGADSLMRAMVEDPNSAYSLTNTKPQKVEAPIFVMPINGQLTRSYKSSHSDYDIALTPTTADAAVMAVEKGTILDVNTSIDGYFSVTIQHAGGYVTVYRNLSEVLVHRNEIVMSGSVIGSVGRVDEGDTSHTAELTFELWRDGVPLNPEPYIFGKGR